MAEDFREDTGEFYPGGTVIPKVPEVPIAGGGGGYVRKGGDVFLPTGEVDGVMRYVKQVMTHDERVGWGASGEGDYVLQGGEFVKL